MVIKLKKGDFLQKNTKWSHTSLRSQEKWEINKEAQTLCWSMPWMRTHREIIIMAIIFKAVSCNLELIMLSS